MQKKNIFFFLIMFFTHFVYPVRLFRSFLVRDFKKVGLNGHPLDGFHIGIYSKNYVIKVWNIDREKPSIEYENFSSPSLSFNKLFFPRGKYERDYKHLTKFKDIDEELKKGNSVIVYCTGRGQGFAYITPGVKIGYGDAKFEGIQNRVHLSSILDKLIARSFQEVTDFTINAFS